MNLKEIQIALNNHGYKLIADGLSGPNTTNAIKDFQKKSGLIADGIVGEATIKALLASSHCATEVTPIIVAPIVARKAITDKPTNDRIELLHPSVRQEVRELVEQANAKLGKHSEIRIVQGYRSYAEQDALYAQGRTKPGKKVTNAKAGQSIHNYGVAIDFALLIDGKEISWDTKADWDGDKIADWMEVVNTFTKAGWQWGGAWKFQDNPHLEKLHDYKPLLAKFNAKDFIPGTNYINL